MFQTGLMPTARSKLLPIATLCAVALAQTGSPAVSLSRMRADLEYLCSENLQGRASLSPGAEMAARYIAAAFEKAGLGPAAADGGFLQRFPLIATAAPSPAASRPASAPDRARNNMAVVREGVRTEFRPGADYRVSSWGTLNLSAPLAFVGYGITAPEYGYDDYAGLDVTGKIVLAFDHEPQERDPRSIFNGAGHTRYANSHVKSEIAGRHGALALMIVSEPIRKHPGNIRCHAASARHTIAASVSSTAGSRRLINPHHFRQRPDRCRTPASFRPHTR